MNVIIRVLIVLVILVSAVSVAALFWYSKHTNAYFIVPNHQDFVVQSGDTASSILRDIRSSQDQPVSVLDRLWLKLNDDLVMVKQGHYELASKESLISFFSVLSNGKQKQFYVSLIEGLTYTQWEDTLRTNQLLIDDIPPQATLYQQLNADDSFCKNPYQSLEGCFLADTYAFTAGDSARSILLRAFDNMYQSVNRIWQERFHDIALVSAYELLIMASIIEKETAVANERELISGVFNNRLHSNMRLQTDPTVIYGVGREFDGDITRKHLRTKTPYNTYMIKGLPITPIAMVGNDSLNAAAKPSDTDYLYFVAKGDGTHQFSESLSEHNSAVARYQLNKGK